MNFLKTAVIAATFALGATAAGAATLSFSGSGTSGSIPADFSNHSGGQAPELVVGAPITIFSASSVGGLVLSDPSMVTYTYYGSEAAHVNTAVELAFGTLFNNKTSSIGDTASAWDDGSFVDFLFRDITDGEEIANYDTASASAGLSIGFYVVDDYTVYALFGDGAGDSDYDDLVIKISAIPLPAGALLLLSGLGGIAVLRRRKQAA